MPWPFTLLINLADSTDRLLAAQSQLSAFGLAFKRLEAFDGRKYPPEAHPSYDLSAALHYMGRPLNGGEVGCFESHRLAAEIFLQSGKKHGLVLEDDMSLNAGAGEVVNWLVSHLADDESWDFLTLGWAAGLMATPVCAIGDTGYKLVRAHYLPPTTTSVLWTRRGAKQFLVESAKMDAPVDLFLRRWAAKTGRALTLDKPAITHSGAVSIIDAGDHQAHRKEMPRSFHYYWADVRREATDYGRAIGHMFHYRTAQKNMRL